MYQPLKIAGNQTGLVQDREDFILPDDAYPELENAFVWRERIKRKQGYKLLGRLQRSLTVNTTISAGGAGTITVSLLSGVIAIEPNAQIVPGNSLSPIVITLGPPVSQVLTDSLGLGSLTKVPPGIITTALINYTTGVLTLIVSGAFAVTALTTTFLYNPGLPVMGLRQRELTNINQQELIAFDQHYAYIFTATGWNEFIPGTTWTGNDSDFFWSTNYWVGDGNLKIFWVTNDSGTTGDPIRYTNGISWINFAPQVDAAGNRLEQCLVLLPFRGRLIAFNTLEGANLGASISYSNRIRWAAIGTPFSNVSAIVSVVNANAWRDDIRGQGGFLDIPTSEDIRAVGFVRDNVVVYCENSTWQLRYTGRSIAPFQIEKVNPELGSGSTFSAVQFDTSLVGVGDKGVVECDSFKSTRIDVKIPDLVFYFENNNNGFKRVHGIRDFQQRLAYWTYPYSADNVTFPNKRLVYNYENDSWAIFTDSLTTLGTYQAQSDLTWQTSDFSWEDANFPWINRPALFPSIVGGNQQGFVEYLDWQTTNDVSLTINNITGNTTTATSVKSVNHNLKSEQIIQIVNIPTGSGYSNLNNGIFSVSVIDADNFTLYTYDIASQQFTIPQLDASFVYIGGGQIKIRDNFSIVSKKFNFLDEGQNIQMGFVEVLSDVTALGAITLNVYLDYNDSTPINTLPENSIPDSVPSVPDTFFNSVMPTTLTGGLETTKAWHRVYCPCRGAFITIQWTLSNAQMIGPEQESDVQIDAQILYIRKAGRRLPVGV